MKRIYHALEMVLLITMFASTLVSCNSSATDSVAEITETTITETTAKPATEEKEPATKIKVGIITDMGIDQAEWLQNLVKGLEEYEATNDNVEFKVVEATSVSEFEPKVRAIAESGYDIVITMYSDMADATIAVAKDYPDIKFGSLDGSISDVNTYSNIEEFGLNRTETAYIAGVVAGSSSKAGKVAIVAGADEPVINSIVAGWQQGLLRANPEIDDAVVYANSFTDPTIGKELALSLYKDGYDIVGAAAGGTGVGAAQAAAEVDGLFVAWDNHYPEVFGDEALELGSAVNYFDKMVIQFIEDATSGNYQPGTRVEYGMAQGVCEFESLDNAPLSDETKALVSEVIDEIKNGSIEISSEPLHK